MERLPNELICMICRHCSTRGQANMARLSRRLYQVCNTILYEVNAEHHDASAVFHAIKNYTEQTVIMKTLQIAEANGANLHRCGHKLEGGMTPICTHQGTCSPIHLAATRGLAEVVTFLLNHGVSPDGHEGADITPLFGALSAGKEAVAILLVKRGASLVSRSLGFNALHASACAGFQQLTSLLVLEKNMDVTSKSACGATPIMLAASSGRGAIVHQLITLGSPIYETLARDCVRQDFESALHILETALLTPSPQIQLHQCLDLIRLLILQEVTAGKSAQLLIIRKILLLVASHHAERSCRRPKASGIVTRGNLPGAVADTLDDMLEESLSVNRGNPRVSSLLVGLGAKVRAATFTRLLDACRSPQFQRNKEHFLQKHPTLLQSFELVYTYCITRPPGDRDEQRKSFIRNAPPNTLCLISRLTVRGFALTASGLRRLSHE